MRIAREVEQELDLHERLVVYLSVLEFIIADSEVTDRESAFLKAIADTFAISEAEQSQIINLVMHHCSDAVVPGSCLIYEGMQVDPTDELEGAWVDRHRPRAEHDLQRREIPGFEGQLIFLFLPVSHTIIAYYLGHQYITIAGKTLDPFHPVLFSDGNIIKGRGFDPIHFREVARYFLKENEYSRIVLDGYGLGSVDNANSGIKQFNFCEESGHLVGVIGSAGTGREHLMKILAGLLKPGMGKITLNGYDLFQDRFKLQGVIGFIPSQDLLIDTLTVFETLLINAELCLAGYNREDLLLLVDKTINELGLQPVKNSVVGKPGDQHLSRLQRKMVHLGLELIRDPSILVIDDPVNGLSSFETERVLDVLKELSIRGKLVIVGMEQPGPEFFRMLDRLWILDQGGYMVFQGNPTEALNYFKKKAFISQVRDKECRVCGIIDTGQITAILEARMLTGSGKMSEQRKKTPADWHELYLKEIEPDLNRIESRRVIPRHLSSVPTELNQFLLFGKRNLISSWRSRKLFLLLILAAPITAIIIAFLTHFSTDQGYFFSENRSLPQYLFLSIISTLFIGLLTGISGLDKEHLLIERENNLNLSWFSFINSKLAIIFLVSALQILLFAAAGNYLLEIRAMTLVYWIVLFSLACFANILALNLSAGIRTKWINYLLIPVILVPQILFCGAIIPFDDMPPALSDKTQVPLLGDLAASRWAYEALAVSQFRDNHYERKIFSAEQAISDFSFKSSYLVPRLQTKVEDVRKHLGESGWEERNEQNLMIVRNEIEALNDYEGVFPFEFTDSLYSGSFSDEIADETQGYLTYLKLQLFNMRDEANARKDSILLALQGSEPASQILALKSKYHNNKLADLVLSRGENTRVLEHAGRIIQKKEPVFVYPLSDMGRAHFFAPVKKLNGQFVDTLWYNLSMIWIMIFVLYLTLLTNALKHLVHFFSRPKFYE
ncbi:MAG: ABC transporter permease [Bacteroidales bacterium]